MIAPVEVSETAGALSSLVEASPVVRSIGSAPASTTTASCVLTTLPTVSPLTAPKSWSPSELAPLARMSPSVPEMSPPESATASAPSPVVVMLPVPSTTMLPIDWTRSPKESAPCVVRLPVDTVIGPLPPCTNRPGEIAPDVVMFPESTLMGPNPNTWIPADNVGPVVVTSVVVRMMGRNWPWISTPFELEAAVVIGPVMFAVMAPFVSTNSPGDWGPRVVIPAAVTLTRTGLPSIAIPSEWTPLVETVPVFSVTGPKRRRKTPAALEPTPLMSPVVRESGPPPPGTLTTWPEAGCRVVRSPVVTVTAPGTEISSAEDNSELFVMSPSVAVRMGAVKRTESIGIATLVVATLTSGAVRVSGPPELAKIPVDPVVVIVSPSGPG